MAGSQRRRRRVNISIGEDMEFQILQWLPAKSLIRFKTVCKSWYSLIQSSDFINHRLHHHRNNNNLIVIHPEGNDNFPCRHVFLLSGENYQNSKTLRLPRSVCTRFKWLHSTRRISGSNIGDIDIDLNIDIDDWYVGTCNGIICVRYQTSKLALWNPATREVIRLPNPRSHSESDRHIYHGFVYNAKNDDYKVIRFRIKSKNEVEVYTLRSDSWRYRDFDLPFKSLYNTNTSVGNGSHCWCGLVCRNDGRDENLIISFDINKEVFGTISYPNEFRYDEYESRHVLATIKGELADIHSNYVWPERRNLDFEIFVLKDFNVGESWVQMSKIRLGSQIVHGIDPKGFSDNKIIISVVKTSGTEKLCLVDLITEEVKYLSVLGTGHYSFQVIIYKESLVSIKRIRGVTK